MVLELLNLNMCSDDDDDSDSLEDLDDMIDDDLEEE